MLVAEGCQAACSGRGLGLAAADLGDGSEGEQGAGVEGAAMLGHDCQISVVMDFLG